MYASGMVGNPVGSELSVLAASRIVSCDHWPSWHTQQHTSHVHACPVRVMGRPHWMQCGTAGSVSPVDLFSQVGHTYTQPSAPSRRLW